MRRRKHRGTCLLRGSLRRCERSPQLTSRRVHRGSPFPSASLHGFLCRCMMQLIFLLALVLAFTSLLNANGQPVAAPDVKLAWTLLACGSLTRSPGGSAS